MFDLQTLLLAVPVLLFSVIAHEYAHGYAALRQGDPTAYRLGRLTWNPIKHIDPFLTILMPVVTAYSMGILFGGAKPVPVNPALYRNYRRGDIIVSLAGVAVNAMIVAACVIAYAAVGALWMILPGSGAVLRVAQDVFVMGVLINTLLIGFNLLPIPPLDGSHVFKHLLPPAWAVHYQRVGAAGLLILILLISFGRGILMAWLGPFFGVSRALLALVRPLTVGIG